MHDQGIAKSVGDAEMYADRAVLGLIVDDGQGLWSVDELAREFGGAVDDSLVRLYGAGLVHRVEGGFVFATRAATKALGLAF